jgi:hypothetical protein
MPAASTFHLRLILLDQNQGKWRIVVTRKRVMTPPQLSPTIAAPHQRPAGLSATYSATVVCINGGGNPSDSQHQGTFTASATTGQLSPKNGRLTVPSLAATAPAEQQFLAQPSCPNPNWTPTIPGGISLSNFTYTVSFEGFGGPFITITGP